MALRDLSEVGLHQEDAFDAFAVSEGHLKGDFDAICPRCLRWIEGRDFVRRTAFGPLQHEVCPDLVEAG